MSSSLQKLLILVCIVSYSIGTTAGNAVILNSLLNSGDSKQVTPEKNSRQIPEGTFWSIKVFTPPAFQSGLPPHLCSVFEIILAVQPLRNCSEVYIPSKYTYLDSLPSKPRDPPIA
ncbi:MAG: hypothetical protein WCW35_12635 [Bacteroidota bacterium]